MPKYKVKENNSITYGADKAKGIKQKVAHAGEFVELSEEEALAAAHALENPPKAKEEPKAVEEKGGKK